MQPVTKTFEVQIAKVNKDHGIVYGYAVISKKDGKPYFDLQKEHVPEATMVDFSVDFMKNSRVAKAMHEGEQVGDVIFAMPMTEDIAKSLDIQVKKTGLIIGMEPNPEALKKFEDGTFKGFSIGGKAVYQDEDDYFDNEEEEKVGKKWPMEMPVLLTSVDGHSHLIDLADGRGGETTWQKADGAEGGHSHPWVKDLEGNVKIGAADGHTHEVEAISND